MSPSSQTVTVHPLDDVHSSYRTLVNLLGRGGGGGSDVSRVHVEDDDNFYREIVDKFIHRRCTSCADPCKKPAYYKLDIRAVSLATKHFVRQLDDAFRRHLNITLSQYLFTQLTGYINSAEVLPIQSRTVLWLSRYVQYDVTKGVRTKVIEFLLNRYAEYLPFSIGTASNLNTHIFRPLKADVIAFLTGQDADIASFAGTAVGYILRTNPHFTDIQVKTPYCMLCEMYRRTCK